MKIRRACSVPIALLLLAAGCGTDSEPRDNVAESTSAVVSTCTAQNVAGYPYSGTLCGGSVIDGCTPGDLYSCTGGPRGTTNNCTLSTTCNPGCLTGANSTPVTLNTSAPSANDACFTGTAPLALSSSAITGGNNLTLTATLQAAHSPYAVVNLNALGANIAQPCDVPILLMPAATSINVTLPTAVVASQAQASPWTLISYTDSAGKNRNLVSLAQPLTINTGGSIAIPPLASFAVTDAGGNTISTVAGGANAFTQGSLAGIAPFGGVNVAVTTSPSSALTGGNFTIAASCSASGPTAGIMQATSSGTSNIAATVSANSGSGASISQNITVTPPPLTISSVTLSPSTVTGGGGTSLVTVTMNRAVLASDPSSTVSVRVSEGALSGTQIATFSGCAGSPACTGPLTVPAGASSASLTLTALNVAVQDFVTVAVSAAFSSQSASANLTINPGCTPVTCASLGDNCGSVSDGCGGTLSCGTCPSGQSCTNNVCGSVALTLLTLSPTSVRGGNSSTGTVRLSGAAPSGGVAVALSSSNTSVATVPASVTVAAGATSATFTVTTRSVGSNTSATISGTSSGVTKSATLTVTRR